MYVYPNTTIKILHNIPLDNSYRNTLYFDTKQAQTQYFTGKVKHNFVQCTYQRANSNVIKVGIKVEDLYDCNYLMFQNESFGNKWFYAFILEVNYVNNDVSEIKYEIDVMQTWFFDFSLKQCFVERQHTATDNFGDNIAPEDFTVSDYTIAQKFTPDSVTGFNNYYIALMATLTTTTGVSLDIPGVYDNQYAPSMIKVFDIDNDTEISALLNLIAKLSSENISLLYMVPKKFVEVTNVSSADPFVTGNYIATRTHGKSYTAVIDNASNVTSLDGYIPKNKKLLTYPYNFFSIDDDSGNSLVLPYEDFINNEPSVEIDTNFMPNPSMRVTPTGFKGISGTNLNYQLTISGYPQCAYKLSAFTEWLNTSATRDTLNTLSSVISATSSGVTFNSKTIGSTIEKSNTLSGVTSGLANAFQATSMPKFNGGSNGNITVGYANNQKDFRFYRRCVKKEQAKMIDDYFTMYGYAIREVKIPNINARPHFTYTKTNGCTILGSMPQNDIAKIQGIFDNGVTFWKYPDEVGNYGVDNSPQASV